MPRFNFETRKQVELDQSVEPVLAVLLMYIFFAVAPRLTLRQNAVARALAQRIVLANRRGD